MRVGLIARADRTGLATQTWEFWRNMQPHKTLVINPTWIGHGQRVDESMYTDYMIMDSKPYPETAMVKDPVVDAFLDDLDVIFTCETPYNWYLYKRAQERGVKTVCQFNFEFLDAPGTHIEPDLWAAPSLWRWDDVPYANKVYLPVPVNRDALVYRRRTELHRILHTAGTVAIHNRNGTDLLLEAMDLLPTDVDVNLHLRSHRGWPGRLPRGVYQSSGVMDRYFDMYDGEEDAFFIPRKFGGLCLPLNEAAACGMPVIMSNVEPQNLFLPADALLDAREVTEFMAKCMIGVYETTPQLIADKIVELYKNPELVAKLSDASNDYADSISWERMRPVYEKVFGDLL